MSVPVAVLLFVTGLGLVVYLSEKLVEGTLGVASGFGMSAFLISVVFIGLSDTAFGMTILALVVSIEEVVRELPAALKGRPDISFGNVLGSVLAFFLFSAGRIALVQPVTVGAQTLQFYLPMSLAAIALVSLFMMRKHIPRWAGAVLLLV